MAGSTSSPAEAGRSLELGRALGSLLPIFALGAFALTVGATLTVAGDTLGYDFLAYHAAADRMLSGQSAYDMSFEASGSFGLFYYPPTFLPLMLPFGLLAAAPATWLWTAFLVTAFGLGTAVLPVSTRTRWLVVFLAALSWPFLYALKLGQVGPLLYLLFAVGWRWLDHPVVLGASGALGAAIKMQPGLVLVWAVLTRRWTAVAWGAATLIALAVVATIVAGAGAWSDFLLLVARVSDPVSTPHNFTPGAVAYQLGAAHEAAVVIQWLVIGLVGVLVVVAALRLAAAPSYLVAVVASQLLSPILWDHYALLLLLPVAWLLDRGRWWAVLIPLATALPLVGAIPPVVYPLAFGVTLLALFLERPADAASQDASP